MLGIICGLARDVNCVACDPTPKPATGVAANGCSQPSPRYLLSPSFFSFIPKLRIAVFLIAGTSAVFHGYFEFVISFRLVCPARAIVNLVSILLLPSCD